MRYVGRPYVICRKTVSGVWENGWHTGSMKGGNYFPHIFYDCGKGKDVGEGEACSMQYAVFRM
jgi:hypothetical protein